MAFFRSFAALAVVLVPTALALDIHVATTFRHAARTVMDNNVMDEGEMSAFGLPR